MVTIPKQHILLNQSYASADDAIIAAGEFMVKRSLILPPYIDSMRQRQRNFGVYIGNFVALPHGGDESQRWIKKEGICLIQMPDGVNFGTEEEPKIATLLFATAFIEQQLTILQELSIFCSDLQNVVHLSDAASITEVQKLLCDEQI